MLVIAGASFTAELNGVSSATLDPSLFESRIVSSNTNLIDSIVFSDLSTKQLQITPKTDQVGQVTLTYEIYLKATNEILASDTVNLTVFTIAVDMAFNYDRSNNTGKDGLNLRQDGTACTAYYAPELTENGLEKNSPDNKNIGSKTVLYVADKSVDVYTRFVISPVFDGPITLGLLATSDLAIGGLKRAMVTFGADGVSQGEKSIAGTAGFVKYQSSSKTSTFIGKEVAGFTWNIKTFNGAAIGDKVLQSQTEKITCYTIFDAPSGPWNPADINDNDHTVQPWVDALEFVFETAKLNELTNESTESTNSVTPVDALTKLTTFLYSDFGLEYDRASQYGSDTINRQSFQLANYMSKNKGSKVNCYDQADALYTLSRLLGINTQYVCVGSHFYINPLAEILGKTKGITEFSNHAFVAYDSTIASANLSVIDGTIFDACCGPFVGKSIDDYFSSIVDINRYPSPQKEIIIGNLKDIIFLGTVIIQI